MTDVNSVENQLYDENNSSFVLNQSNVPMDIDFDDEIIASSPTKFNGHRSPLTQSIENENKSEQIKEENFRPRNTELNKSFDILPQVKDDDPPSADSISDINDKNTNVLDKTMELPINDKELEDQYDTNNLKPVDTINTPPNTQSLLPNQFSVEYPLVIPQPEMNVEPSSPTSIDKMTTLTKNIKLNANKTLDGQEPSVSTSATGKSFDTNTFVLKKKDRRKMPMAPAENSFNSMTEDTPPPELYNKQSPLNTPSTSMDSAVPSRTTTAISSSQSSLIEPTRIM